MTIKKREKKYKRNRNKRTLTIKCKYFDTSFYIVHSVKHALEKTAQTCRVSRAVIDNDYCVLVACRFWGCGVRGTGGHQILSFQSVGRSRRRDSDQLDVRKGTQREERRRGRDDENTILIESIGKVKLKRCQNRDRMLTVCGVV